MTSVRSMASLTGGLGGRNSISTNTVSPLIVKQSDCTCNSLCSQCHSVFVKYGYKLPREIILRELITKNTRSRKRISKICIPNDFEDLFLLNIQEKLNHLPKTDKTSLHTAVNMWIRNLVIRNRVGDLQLGIESYQTKINLERPNWDADDYYFKEDYTIVPKPRAVVYRDRNDQRKLMRLNELHKFSDGTLTRVMEKLDHMVKDFHLYEYNKGMETRKWSEDDKRRSKDFITAIEKRIRQRIYRSLESFVGGRIRDIDYRLINRTTVSKRWRWRWIFPVPEMSSVKASANSDIMYSFTSAQDGNPLQDDVRLCLGDDLKKAQDHCQRQANSLEKEISILKEKVSTLEKNKGVDLECVKCHMLKVENEKLKEEALKLTKFEKSTHCLNEMLNNQKPSGEKLGLGFNSFEASSSGTKEIKFMKAQKKAFSDKGPINMGGPLSVQAAPKANMGPPPATTPGSEKSAVCQDICDEFAKIMHDEFEMSMMGELNFFLGLQIKQMEDGILFNQSKYIKEMLKKFGLEDSKPMKTPMSSDTKLMKDEVCESVDSTKYQGMIGSLLYLMTSRPDIMFSICLCARFQEAPKTSHLEAVKRIFRYIKGTTHLRLWCPKGTGIETVVYADSDHAGDYVDR
ncbi:retrovirus-related pol polyprotein from transposon TNT 1-94 [Tanacetum coccineum]|uniref:Retrovirus-related pol polyprotein from transposon TNT 1-94 n=1 Tax=Tanacetum coccineum TaxID=301880 RepID=A0ABQ5GES0_9ASTR